MSSFYPAQEGIVKVKSINRHRAGAFPLGGHHLVLGEIRDYITGEILVDTHDERYRQKVARFLVAHKGYIKEELKPRIPIDLNIDGKQARIRLDLMVCIDEQVAMLIKYAPGSLTTRHQVALAASRLLAPYQVPLSVVTNGKEADIIDNYTDSVIAEGLDGIFSRRALADYLQAYSPVFVTDRHRDMAARILYAYEVDGRCPCDDTVCEYEQR
jgi:hypothetical protein